MAQPLPAPTISLVECIDLWGANPRGKTYRGVAVTLAAEPPQPAGLTLAGRLLAGSTPIAWGIGGVGTTMNVEVAPPAPLAGGPFWVQVMWCSNQVTEPAGLKWGEEKSVAKAPVLVAGVNVTGGRVELDGKEAAVTLGWETADGPQLDLVYVQLARFAQATGLEQTLELKLCEGSSATFEVPLAAGYDYVAYVAPAALLSGTGKPKARSIGPFSQAIPIPVDAPQVTAAAYDGSRLTVAWTPPPKPAQPGAPPVPVLGHSLVVLADADPVASFPAAAEGAAAVIDLASLKEPVAVAGTVSYGGIAGPLVAAQEIVAEAPSIADVKMAASTKTPGDTDVTVAVIEPASLPTGAVVRALLLKDGAPIVTKPVAAGPAATATLSAALEPSRSYAVLVQAVIEDGGGNVLAAGPACAELPLPVAQPAGLTGSYDGERVALAWTGAAEPHLSGYRVDLAGSLTASYAAGPEPALSVPAPALAAGGSLQVTLTALAGRASGVPASFAYTVPEPAAPSISELAQDGDVVSLSWSPSAGPWLDGYLVTATPGASASATPPSAVTVTTGLETSATVRLPAQEAPCEWKLTVAALARGKAGPSSAAVALFPTTALALAVTTDASAATVKWELSPWSTAVQAALGAASLQVQVLDEGNVVAVVAVAAAKLAENGETAVPLPKARTGRLSAAVQLVSAIQTGSRSGPVAVLATQPAVLFGALLDGSLDLRWSATGEAGVSGYEVCCGAVCATTPDTHLTLPLGLQAAGEVTVTPIGPGSTGPAARVAVGTAPYEIGSGSYADGKLTVALTAPAAPQPEEVWVDALLDGEPAARATVKGSATSAELELALSPGAAASVRASGVGAGPLTPAGTARPIPTTAPSGVRAVYDGENVHVAWDPVADPGVSGYLITVAGATPTVAPQYVDGAAKSEGSVAAILPAPVPGAATVTVQAAVAFGSERIDGPPSAAVAPAPAGAVRAVAASAQSAGQPPYLYRRGAYSSLAKVKGKDATVLLPDPFASATEFPEAKDAAGIFKLAPRSQPPPAALPYRLTIAAASAWQFEGEAARAGLRASYREFLREVGAKGPAQGGIALVRQAVATALPQTFAETLFYRYGLWLDEAEGKLRGVDLEAGLCLRVSGAEYQAPPGIVDSRAGFVTVGTETYELGQVFPAGSRQAGLGPSLSVDAFLSRLFPGGTGGSSGTIAAGPVDFFGAGARQACFRLFYPQRFEDSESPGSAAEPTASNVFVLGAPTWTALEEATALYESEKNFSKASSQVFSAYFRGRVALTPLLAVTVNGRPRWVPLGTTVRDLLAAAGSPALGAVVPATPEGVSLTRVVADVYDSELGGAPLRRDRVDLSGADVGALPPALWPLDLPLLGGDELSVAAWEPPLPSP